MYFIGQTRFSLYIPKSNAWNVSNFTEEEYVAHLFSDERMSIRAKIFAEISVPLLAKMKKNYDYRHIVSYSSILPEKWKQMLIKLQEQHPFLYLHEADTQGNPLYEILKDRSESSVAFFRLDDDDLLSINFLDSLSKYNNSAFDGMAVSFGKGFAGRYKDGHFIDFRDCKQRFIAIGQAYIGTYTKGHLSLPTMHSHHVLDEHCPVVVDSKDPMYIHTHHDQQDTNYRFSNNAAQGSNTIESDLIRFQKTTQPKAIIDLFPTLRDDVKAFIEDRRVIFGMNDVVLNDKTTSFVLGGDAYETIFECKYSLAADEFISSSKAFAFSIFLEKQESNSIDRIEGLNLSSNPNIGWYKYVAISSGLAKGSFSFSIPKDTKLKELKVICWDDRIKAVKINEIEISC